MAAARRMKQAAVPATPRIMKLQDASTILNTSGFVPLCPFFSACAYLPTTWAPWRHDIADTTGTDNWKKLHGKDLEASNEMQRAHVEEYDPEEQRRWSGICRLRSHSWMKACGFPNFKFSEWVWVEQNSCGWPSFTAFKVLSDPLGKVRTLEAHWKGFQFGVAGKKNGTEVGVAVLRDLAQARMI